MAKSLLWSIITYTSDHPDTPPELRAVAHAFAYDPASGRYQLLPATQTGSDAEWCAQRMAAFLESEIARDQRRAKNAKAMGERMRGYYARYRAKRGCG